MTPAVPVPELDPIPGEDPPIEMQTVKPPKFAKLVTVSLEAYRDATPAVLAGAERELFGAIGEGFDAAAFTGAANSAHPGILSKTGVLALAPTTLTNLDVFVDAKAALKAAGATATAIYVHPLAYAMFGRLKTGTDSNEGLVAGQLATDAPAEQILGVPVYQSTAMPAHRIIVAHASELMVVRRTQVETEVDEHYLFASAGVGVRTIARLQLVVAQPEAVLVVTTPTPMFRA